LQSKVEELQNRVLSMSDDLRQSQTKWVDATRELRESEDKVKKKDDRSLSLHPLSFFSLSLSPLIYSLTLHTLLSLAPSLYLFS
jgi:hypothetical protein